MKRIRRCDRLTVFAQSGLHFLSICLSRGPSPRKMNKRGQPEASGTLFRRFGISSLSHGAGKHLLLVMGFVVAF